MPNAAGLVFVLAFSGGLQVFVLGGEGTTKDVKGDNSFN